ncbi:MAG: efflux RND transporter periplasmic adaptor subunit [Gammaproteobacteria bacterium]|nr:efflux RND transporter periplasmic adaptor subunit [Gammaproteobacteria bacterium]
MKNSLWISLFFTLVTGVVGGYFLAIKIQEEPAVNSDSSDERKVLFYRNPMNPAITSPTFQQDEMGMDYIPVFAEQKKSKERKILFYRNPMNPAITSPTFQQDEMGMDYIPVFADGDSDSNSPAGTVTIDPVVVQNIGVRTEKAIKRSISRRLNSLGRVDFNEERLARLHPKTSGWIEKLRIDATGRTVKKDAILLSIYSPDLVAAQREYLVALKNWEGLSKSTPDRIRESTRTLLDSALDRLELLDVPAHQLIELKVKREIKKYLHIHSPFSGTVMHIGAREGQYVTPKDELYLIADLQKIWVYVDVYEDEMAWVKLGDEVEMKVRAAPGRIFKGQVSFVYPYLEGKTRTVRVRLVFDNSENILKPGMFANVVMRTDTQAESIVISSSAIVRSGNRDQVFVVRAPGKFEPREILLGLSADGYTQILNGLNEGEEVVTSSTFLIDSESKLKEATAKMMEAMKIEGESGSSGMDMDGMEMDDMNMGDMDMDNLSMDAMDMNMSEMDSAGGKPTKADSSKMNNAE